MALTRPLVSALTMTCRVASVADTTQYVGHIAESIISGNGSRASYCRRPGTEGARHLQATVSIASATAA